MLKRLSLRSSDSRRYCGRSAAVGQNRDILCHEAIGPPRNAERRLQEELQRFMRVAWGEGEREEGGDTAVPVACYVAGA